MDISHVVESYLKYRSKQPVKSHRSRYYGDLNRRGHRKTFTAPLHKLSIVYGNRNVEPLVVPEDSSTSRKLLSPGRFVFLLERNLEVTLDRLTSFIFRYLTLSRRRRRYNREIIKLCKFVCAFFRDLPSCGVQVKRAPVNSRRLSRKQHGCYKVCNATASHFRRSKKCLLSALWCCLHLKGALSGISVKPWHMLQLIRRVATLRKHKLRSPNGEWADLHILKAVGSQGTGLWDLGANFTVNVLFSESEKLPSHLVLQSRLCQWRSLRHDYVSEMIHVILFIDYIFMGNEHSSLLNGFRTYLNDSFNRRLFTATHYEIQSSKYPYLCKRLYSVYGVLNRKLLFHELQGRFVPYSFVVERMLSAGVMERGSLLYGKSDLNNVKWLLMLVTLLLTSAEDLKGVTWLVIRILSQFFHEGGVNYGMIRCPNSTPCFRCLIEFTCIACGLCRILTLLPKSPLYPSHISVVNILLRKSISKLCTTFCDSYDRLGEAYDVFLGFKEVTVCQSDGDIHSTPRSLKFAAHLVRQRCLALLSRYDMKPDTQHANLDVVPHPVYLKLLFALQNAGNVNVSPTVEATLKGQRRHEVFDYLAFQKCLKPWLPHEFRTTTRGRLHFQGYVSLLSQIYLNHKGLDDCLSDFVVQDHLGVMQRTQACHLFAKNPQVTALVLPQLVQSLSVDPGDRVWHLLSVTLRNDVVRERLPYYLACMAHTSDNHSVAHKASSFLELITGAARESESLRQELRNIYMHGELLQLTSYLTTLDVDDRREALLEGLERVNDTYVKSARICIFEGSVESDGYTLCYGHPSFRQSKKIRTFETETSRLLKSATRAPFTLDFRLEHGDTTRYIYKMDDDMRQDALVVQLKLFLMHIFRTYNLESYLQPFLVVPYSTALSTVVKLRSASLAIMSSDDVGSDMEPGIHKKAQDVCTTPIDMRLYSDSQESCHCSASTYISASEDSSQSLTPRCSAVDPLDRGYISPAEDSDIIPCRWCTGCRPHCGSSGDIPASLHGVVGCTHILGGIVGFIPGAVSRHSIGRDYGGSLENYFTLKFGPRGGHRFNRAMDNFVNSLAGYSLLCFLLQVKDRHNGNLMISSSGHILHIDYGFILGSSPAADVHFEQAPFKLTKEMTDLLGGVESDNFQRYVRLLVSAYLCVRQESEALITFVKLLEHSGMTCFRRSSVEKLRQRLFLHATPERAASYMLRKIHIALHSMTTMVYDMVQAWQQGIAH
ncbi:Phosphatidylinositol 4-kinase [Babesia sp. Xinjiang]|uniref:Phosphatidylinositol 4-kinase n=1 Tax=Babesia sp. Xinjiang TaxID=462227 RepID=UPI000A2219F0|nr:Phosphatidylinositol 4-kinase [Babesia sp. Xinjiang]ORM40757.1 Phosphatidylinositol 4-kinase [Babesia sp. Xinjiang]